MGSIEIGVVFVIVLLLIVWLVSRSWRIRDSAYRTLATDSASAQQMMVQAQQELVRQQRQANEDLADLRSRVTNIENLLREVG